MKTKRHSSSLPSGLGRGRTKTTRRSRWLGLLVMLALLVGSGTAFGQNPADFDLNAQSNVSGSTILTRWSNWVRSYKQPGTNNYYTVQNFNGENGWRGWSKGETNDPGRYTTWWYSSWVDPNVNYNHNEDCQYWYHFKYENIDEVTPDHPYVEIWTPCYDGDSQSAADIVKASALYVTNAQGRDVLVGVQQTAYRQIDNYYYNYNSSGSNVWGSIYGTYNSDEISNAYNNYTDKVSPGILINWGTASENKYFYGSAPEWAKLRYYPGWNMGETFDMSFIVNWDMDANNNNYNTSPSTPRYVSVGESNLSYTNHYYWSVDWPNMFVTKGIRITNHVAAPTVERQRNGNVKVSASGVKTYTDFKTTFVVNNTGKLDLGNSASGNKIFSGIDHKQPISIYSNVYRSFTQKNGSFQINYATFDNSSDSPFTTVANKDEYTVQEFKKSYDAIPGCVYPLENSVQVTFDKWNKKTIITWESCDKSNRNTSGSFYVYRYEGESTTPTLVGNVGVNSQYKLEDPDVEYGKTYTYKVSFILDNWQASDGPEPSLTATSDVLSTEPTYNFDITNSITSKENSVLLSWKHDTPTNNTQITFKVWRCLDNSSFYDQEGHTIQSKVIEAMQEIATVSAASSGTTTTYEDNNLASSCSFYWYRITADVLGGTFASPLIGLASMSGSTKIKGFTANRGTYTNVVKLQWDVDQVGTSPSRFVVYRRLLGSTSDEDYRQVHVTSGTESSYFFEDNTAQPGQFYEYKVVSQSNCVDNVTGEASYNVTSWKETDGFCQSRGIISGRITYGTGTAVPNARVLLTKSSESGSDTNQFYSMKVNPQGGILWSPTASTAKGLFEGKAFTLQMYVRPDAVVADGSTIFDGGGNFAVLLKPVAETDQSEVYVQVGSDEPTATGVTLTNGDFVNVSVTCDGTTGWTVRTIDKDGNLTSETVTAAAVTWAGTDGVAFGCDRGFTAEHAFTGYLDDIRLWSKALTDDDVLGNYDRLLIGTEADLKIYWPMDEGVAALPFAYDYSKTQGVANENHGQKQTNTSFDNKVIPSETQLGLYGKTDTEGNYVIRGIPFTGEGTNYMVRPTMGIHEFSPKYQTRFINTEALTHSGVDFEDVSSFEVSGTVFFKDTDIPVDSVMFYVDGIVCSKDGNILYSDANGEYKISVPIGNHYITVKKNDHVFVNGGRYPADPNNVGTTHEFVNPISQLTFTDSTLVTFAGRVTGGDIEYKKPLGFGQSVNNLGKAQLTLQLDDPRYHLNWDRSTQETGTEAIVVASASPDTVRCEAYRNFGSSTKAQQIIINTDPATGEFAVRIPPVLYSLQDVKILNQKNQDIPLLGTAKPQIDARTVNPMRFMQDSLFVDSVFQRTFEYSAAWKSDYHSPSFFEVVQKGQDDGTYGVPSVTFFDFHTAANKTLPCINADGTYPWGAPIFVQGEEYTFNVKGYEQYTNYDNSEDGVMQTVPLSGSTVTASNGLSDQQKVYAAAEGFEDKAGTLYDMTTNDFTLDDNGEATYVWRAGLPEITSPYTGRGFNFTYTIGGSQESWRDEAQSGIILGMLPTGNNFVTAGPDLPIMVLRDPPGSGSSATWEKGSSHSVEYSGSTTATTETSIFAKTSIGFTMVLGTWAPGVLALEHTAKMEDDQEKGVEIKAEIGADYGRTVTVTTTKSISTSDDPDWVGADADLIYGTGTNLVYGLNREVKFAWDAIKGDYGLVTDDGVSQGLEFSTTFLYTQRYIKETLLPNLEMLRNNLFTTVSESDFPDLKNYPNTGSSNLYVTYLTPNDEGYGSDNSDAEIWGDQATSANSTEMAGPSYTVVKPGQTPTGDFNCMMDSVEWYNTQIKIWKELLANNEKAKVTAKKDRSTYLEDNYSISSGGSFTSTLMNDTTNTQHFIEEMEITSHLNLWWAAGTEACSFKTILESKTGVRNTNNAGETNTYSTTTSFTLTEDAGNALTVDVFKAPDNYSPIFITRAGQTSCPYEGETYTEFYTERGKPVKLNEATMQIERPQILINKSKNAIVAGVPNGRPATFNVVLTNNSDTKSDGDYRLFYDAAANSNHARILLDGDDLNDDGGHVFNVAYGDSVVTKIQLVQTDEGILEYDSIPIIIASQCEPDVIADTAYISAQYVPSSSDVTLEIPNRTLNSESSSTVLAMTLKDYDINYNNFKSLEIQSLYENDENWSKVKEYRTEAFADELYETLQAGNTVFNYDMKDKMDGHYRFRVQSTTMYGNEPIYVYSNVIDVVKDMSCPQLFGNANPSDGVLNYGDEISVTFNEDIRQNLLTKSYNFKITAALNGQRIAHSVALAGQNTECAARTEASINLAKKDFSTDLWVNYTGAGTILSHGNGAEKFEVGTDTSNHLVVKIGDQTYTSTKTITPNKWVFLTLNYKYVDEASGILSAMFAEDASQTMLFTDLNVAAYDGNGSLAVGKNLTGSVHELTLWDKARSCLEAQADMYMTKKPSTPYLIGYWKLDEGEGLTATDYARNRHMTLAGQTWYINNVNKAVTLPGNTAMKLNISECSALATEDYAVEMWFKGSKADNGNKAATLFSAGDESVEMGFNASGALTLTSRGTAYEVTKTDYLDNAWHHVALNVLRSGNATVYVDGQTVSTISASSVNSLAGSELIIGATRNTAGYYSNYFKGSFDDIRFWKATLTGDYLKRFKSTRLTGEEAGLVAYYPFEAKIVDEEYNQVVTSNTAADIAGKKYEATLLNGNTLTIGDESPKLKEAPNETNINFSFVANERTIVINLTDLTDAPDLLEGTTVNFTVRNVFDTNGNESLPVLWTAYVKQNQLLWEGETEVTLEQQSGESTTFEATIVNESGNSENWTLSGLPTWLTASATSGTLTAKSKKTITFTVAESKAIGKYEQTIYLTGNNNISEPLTINLKVKGEEPGWAVNTGGYQFTMNIVGQLQFQDKLSTDEDDMVAAFNEAGECVGVARPQYESAFDTYFTMMTVYGNLENDGEMLTFKAYDASTGKVYPVVETAEDVYFQKDTKQGTLSVPFVWNATDKIEQVIALKEGWNWMSLYVTPDDMAPESVMSDALDILNIINGPTSTFEYDPTLGWGGTLTEMGNASMYKLNAKEAGQTTVVGSPANVAATTISVKKNALTWIGYPPSFTLSPADAFAGLDPKGEDMVKSQDAFAVYSYANAKWVGTLKVMEPGKGYMYQSNATADKTFTYPSTAPAGGAAKVMAYAEPYDYHFSPVAPETYPGNMAVIGQVVENGLPVEGIEVAAFVDDECRATIVSDADGYLFLLVPGDGKARMMTLRAYILGDETALDLPLTYQADKKLGTLGSPVLIDITDLTTGIGRLREDAADGEYYDLSGRKLGTRPYQPGVYIRNGEKVVIKRK